MTYIFVFLGEFGYEILNWQGVVRRFAQTIEPGDKNRLLQPSGPLFVIREGGPLYRHFGRKVLPTESGERLPCHAE